MRSIAPLIRRSMSTKPSSSIPVFRDLSELKTWRRAAREQGKSVGVVPTMGALHAGHINLVKQSMKANPLTCMTLFINPTQFAPHEDLAQYPKTLQSDLEKLSALLPPSDSTTPAEESPLVVFAPNRETMYPLSMLTTPEEVEGMLQDTSKQKGAFVEVKGWGDVLEGSARPQFFRGVATVCTKLFNAVEPDHAYFGQKDIQQALLLKLMLKDLLMSYPSPENFHIIPTTRDPSTSLALSSRNAYLSPTELRYATVLINALSVGKGYFDASQPGATWEDLLGQAGVVIDAIAEQAKGEGVVVKRDYVEVFERESFRPLRGPMTAGEVEGVICGAVWVGKTRLIDNLLLGWEIEEV